MWHLPWLFACYFFLPVCSMFQYLELYPDQTTHRWGRPDHPQMRQRSALRSSLVGGGEFPSAREVKRLEAVGTDSWAGLRWRERYRAGGGGAEQQLPSFPPRHSLGYRAPWVSQVCTWRRTPGRKQSDSHCYHAHSQLPRRRALIICGYLLLFPALSCSKLEECLLFSAVYF